MGQENKKFEKPADVADPDSSRKENEIQVQKEVILQYFVTQFSKATFHRL